MKKEIIKITSVFFISVMITTIFGELLLRAYCKLKVGAAMVRYVRTRNVFHSNPGNVVFDEVLGYALAPNLKTHFSNEEFDTVVSTNSQGFRDDEESLSNPDILMLGDSFGFGWGINKNETCEDVLEMLSGLTVLNMGVPGYETIHEFLSLREWISVNLICNKTVIFLFFENDFHYDPELLTTQPIANDFRLKLPAASKQSFMQIFMKNDSLRMRTLYRLQHVSYLFDFSLYAFNRMQFLFSKFFNTIDNKAIGIELERKARTFSFLIKEIKALSRKNNFNILFVLIPNKEYFVEPDQEKWNIIKVLLHGEGVDFIDMALISKLEDYFLLDDHWNAHGHRRAAFAIKNFLNKNNLI